MSIYSGFATRFQQQSYDYCIDSLLYILQKRILKFYQGEDSDDQKFVALVVKLHLQMKNMEKSKYFQPKSSQSIKELIKYFHTQQNGISNSNNQLEISKKKNKNFEENDKNLQVNQLIDQNKKKTFWVQRAKLSKQEENRIKTQQQQVQTQGKIHKNGNKTRQNDFPTKLEKKNSDILNKKQAYLNQFQQKHLNQQKRIEQVFNILNGSHRLAKSHVFAHKYFLQPRIQADKNFSQLLENRKIKSLPKQSKKDEIYDQNNQVNGIIKDYIIKAKKKQIKSQKNKQNKSYTHKIYDF